MNTTMRAEQCQEEKRNGEQCTRDARWLIETPSGLGLIVCGVHKKVWTEDSPERAAHWIGDAKP